MWCFKLPIEFILLWNLQHKELITDNWLLLHPQMTTTELVSSYNNFTIFTLYKPHLPITFSFPLINGSTPIDSRITILHALYFSVYFTIKSFKDGHWRHMDYWKIYNFVLSRDMLLIGVWLGLVCVRLGHVFSIYYAWEFINFYKE